MAQRCVILVNDAEVAEGYGNTRASANADAMAQVSNMDHLMMEEFGYSVEYHTEQD